MDMTLITQVLITPKVAHKLMLALGYDQYGKLSVGIRLVDVLLITIVVAQGGDWGSRVSPWLY